MLNWNGHLSSEANLYFSSSFFVVTVLCTTLKKNCISLSSFEDLYIFTKQHPNQEVLKSFFSQPLLWRVIVNKALQLDDEVEGMLLWEKDITFLKSLENEERRWKTLWQSTDRELPLLFQRMRSLFLSYSENFISSWK